MENTVIPKYKKKTIYVPTCPVCNQELSGNNSIALPYKCKCGTWKFKFDEPNKFIINPNE